MTQHLVIWVLQLDRASVSQRIPRAGQRAVVTYRLSAAQVALTRGTDRLNQAVAARSTSRAAESLLA
jgi:hypothetical protein